MGRGAEAGMGTPEPIKAAQYLRMSTDHQRYSLANQAAAIALYAEAHQFEIVRTYQDAGKSGVTAKGRDGLRSLLSDIVGGRAEFATVLVLDVSRWGRFQDPDQGAHYEFVCRDAGVAVRYCGELFDDDGSVGSSILKHLKRVMAGEYSRELSDKVRAGKRRQASRGFNQGGSPPYGFRRQIVNVDGSAGQILEEGHRASRADQNVRRVPGPEHELRNIRSIFRWFVDDRMKMIEIAERLNAGGKVWADGSPWTAARVREVIGCELVTGRQIVGRTYYRFGRTGPNDPKDWIATQLFKPIVTRKRFEEAQRQRRALPGSRRFTDRELLDQLRRLAEQYGKLTPTIIREHGAASLSVYQKRFGSFISAYELAGFRRGRARRIWDDEGSVLSDEALLARLKEHFLRTGNIGGRSIDKDRSLPSAVYVISRFGSLPAAYAAAGIPYPRPRAKGQRHCRSPGPPVDLAFKGP